MWLGLETQTTQVRVTRSCFDLYPNSHVKPVKLPWRGSGQICASKSALWLLWGEQPGEGSEEGQEVEALSAVCSLEYAYHRLGRAPKQGRKWGNVQAQNGLGSRETRACLPINRKEPVKREAGSARRKGCVTLRPSWKVIGSSEGVHTVCPVKEEVRFSAERMGEGGGESKEREDLEISLETELPRGQALVLHDFKSSGTALLPVSLDHRWELQCHLGIDCSGKH